MTTALLDPEPFEPADTAAFELFFTPDRLPARPSFWSRLRGLAVRSAR